MPARTPLPLNFYLSNTRLFGTMIFGGVLIWLGMVMFSDIDDIFVQLLSALTGLTGVFFVYFSLSLLLNPKPQFSITRYHISHYTAFRLSREKIYPFKDIQSMSLDYNINRDVKHWHITLQLKNGKKQILRLNKALLNGDAVNEKEVFDLIEQVFNGQIPPTRHHIEMDIHDRMTGWGIFMVLFMGAMLIFAIVMGMKG